MFAMTLCDWEDVRMARECADVLARAAGVAEPELVAMAVGEIGNNCVEHRDDTGIAVLRMACEHGRLILHAENPCHERPDWQTSKPEIMEGFRAGGYGLLLVRNFAHDLRCTWQDGRAVVDAEFA